MTGAPHDERLRRRVLALLLAAYVLNFVDRQIIGVLAIPIKADLGLDDRQLGLMGGLAFAIFYSTLALPIARIADRRGRVPVIALAVMLWSAATALCGAAQNFAQLFLARMAVGVGEAGGVAPSYALIADHFPPGRRARALGLFSLGVPIGSSLGIMFGGWLAASLDWRWAFAIIGLGGIPLGWAIARFVPEPARPARAAQPGAALVARTLAGKPGLWLLALGAGSGSVIGYGLMFWLPTHFARTLGLSVGQVGLYFGALLLVGGSLGTLVGGWLGDRLGPARPAAYALIPAACLLLAAPLYAAGVAARDPLTAWLLLLPATALGLAWFGPVVGAVQQLSPPAMRATASALFLLVNNLLGLGLGVVLIGEMSVRMAAAHDGDALRQSILYGLAFYPLAALFYLAAAPLLRRGMERGERPPA